MRFLRYALPLLMLAPAFAQAQSTATYRVTFESVWSADTHPDGFPPDPHYSPLIGAAHSADASLWEVGGLASPGIEQMAETGGTSQLRGEVSGLVGDGTALSVVSGGGIALSPGSVSTTFDVTEDHALVSLVTMVAPSPDWFVGVSGFDLRDDGTWFEEVSVALYAYDAGTDSGANYTSPNQDTNPAEPIFRIEEPPFVVGDELAALGTFTFTLLNTVSNEETVAAARFALDAPAPNPATSRSAFRLSLDQAQAVQIDVFDILGRRVETVHRGALAAGVHPFSLDVRSLTSGLYVIRASGSDTQATRRLVVQGR
ncbi:MAG: spondin domain-containing protein [Bacteroidota bacterium]